MLLRDLFASERREENRSRMKMYYKNKSGQDLTLSKSTPSKDEIFSFMNEIFIDISDVAINFDIEKTVSKCPLSESGCF